MSEPGDVRTVVLDPAARDELAEAVANYDAQRAGLGDEFLHEVKRTVTRIRDFPEAWPTMSRRSRRCRVTRFPYGLVYQVTSKRDPHPRRCAPAPSAILLARPRVR